MPYRKANSSDQATPACTLDQASPPLKRARKHIKDHKRNIRKVMDGTMKARSSRWIEWYDFAAQKGAHCNALPRHHLQRDKCVSWAFKTVAITSDTNWDEFKVFDAPRPQLNVTVVQRTSPVHSRDGRSVLGCREAYLRVSPHPLSLSSSMVPSRDRRARRCVATSVIM